MQRRDIDGVHFIRLTGNAEDRARGHARLLKKELSEGALPYLSKKNEWLIRRGPGPIQLKAVQEFAVWFYHSVLLKILVRHTLPEQKRVVAALVEESGISHESFERSLMQADGLMLLSRISLMKHLVSHLPAGGLPGCSSAVVSRDWTASGRTFHGRNMDYPVVGPWERHPVVMFVEPDEPGEIPHVGVTTAGVHTSGLTAMNREGLTLCAHAHFGRKVSLSGQPIFTIGEQIIRRAKTIGEAVDIARSLKRTANWALVVASGKEKDGAVIEMSPDETRVHPMNDGFLSHSNFFHTPELHAQEALLSGGVCDDLVGRLCRLRQILEPNRGSIEPKHLVEMLGDHVDYSTGEERVFGNTVSVVTTIKSVVFDPEDQKMWVSTRRETPVGLGEFVQVDTENFWKNPDAPMARMPGKKPADPRLADGIRHYRGAYQAWHTENHKDDFGANTLVELRKALAAYPKDGNVWMQAGLVAFSLGNIDEARGFFEATLERKLVPSIARVRDLFLARCHDLEGRRDAAVELYTRHLECEDPKIRAAFRKGVRKPYRRREVGTLILDMQFPDVMQY